MCNSGTSSEFREELSSWGLSFLTHVLKLLDLETSPALCVMMEVLEKLDTSQMNKTRFWKTFKWTSSSNCTSSQSSYTSLEHFLNAQPAKVNLLTQCDLVLAEDVCNTFKVVGANAHSVLCWISFASGS